MFKDQNCNLAFYTLKIENQYRNLSKRLLPGQIFIINDPSFLDHSDKLN